MGTEIQSSTPVRGRNGDNAYIYAVIAVGSCADLAMLVFVATLRWLAILLLVAGGLWFGVSLMVKIGPLLLQSKREEHERKMKEEDQALRAWVASLGDDPYSNTVYEAGGTVSVTRVFGNRPQTAVREEEQEEPMQIEAPRLPDRVRYEDIRSQIPQGHILVGVGHQGVETKPQAVGACLWIVGLSGTGKTSTTVLRVDERKQEGHRFLGADPHWFKDDSLFHAIYETTEGYPGPYRNDFLSPMAKTPAETLAVLQTFLNEFQARKGGLSMKPWQRITLLVDEVGSLMDKATATTPEEKAIIDLLPSIARICGQEARNFHMGGIFISQQATGIAWLRKVALMVIVHQLHQENEKKLATNNDPEVMKEMKYWPIGRTYVFGVGFGTEGPRTVQQPLFEPKTDDLSFLPRSTWEDLGRYPEGNGEETGSTKGELEDSEDMTPLVLKNFLNSAGKMRAKGDSLDAILKAHGLTPGGRNNQNLKSLLEQEGA